MARTSKQRAASVRNLMKARAARTRMTTGHDTRMRVEKNARKAELGRALLRRSIRTPSRIKLRDAGPAPSTGIHLKPSLQHGSGTGVSSAYRYLPSVVAHRRRG